MESRFSAQDEHGLPDLAENHRRARAIADAILVLIGDQDEWVGTLSQIQEHLGMTKLYRGRHGFFADEMGGAVAEMLYEDGVVMRFKNLQHRSLKKIGVALVRRGEF